MTNPSEGPPTTEAERVVYPLTAARIRAAIDATGLADGVVAEMIGVLPDAVSHWVNGHRLPTTTKQHRLAAVLNVTTEQLVDVAEIVRVDEEAQKRRGTKVKAAHKAKRESRRAAAKAQREA